jgi:protein-disulfide isomerase
MDKRFWAFLLIIAAVLGGIFFITNTNKAGAPSESKGTATNHVTGEGASKVTLVEYGDFQCPACGAAYSPVKQVKEKYAKEIKFQFRNFPLSSIHPNAIAASRAAEAADLQGKFWEMHDKLYEENITLLMAQQSQKQYQTWSNASNPSDIFNGYARDLGLDVEKFKQDFKSSLVNDRVQADLKEGTRLGVDSTPTFFLNGKKISNPENTLEAFSKVIDAEIVKQGGTPPASTPAAAPGTTPTAQPGQ